MGKKTRIWLIVAASLVLGGCIIFGGVMTVLKWDFSKLSTIKYETNIYEFSENFSKIDINTDTAKITFALSADGKCKVECFEEATAKHSVAVQNDTLSVKLSDKKAWYDHIGINFATPKLTVYLPKAEYEALSAKTSTGSITLEKLTVGTLDLAVTTGKITVSDTTCLGDVKIKVSTGKTNLTNITCKNLTSTGNTGDITLKNVVAAEKFSVERSTGDVTFNGCDAAEIVVETDTGDVGGSLLTDKVIWAKTSTGKVNVPKLTTGGRCEITTDTGDIKITIG